VSRRSVLILAGVLLIQSIVVALVFTPQPHSGGDNAGYVSLAHSLLDRGSYLELWDPEEPAHTKYPPIFPAFLALALLLGAKSWAALKLVPAFSTVLAVAFTFLWARDRRGATLGVAVALLLGLSSSVVYYSQWVLSDPTFLAVTLAALWALQKGSDGEGPAEGKNRRELWLGVGMALVVLAYFTRSAGLPLVLATMVWLGFRRRGRALVVFALAFGLPAFLWWLRGSLLGGSEYVSEFWLVDPYQPELGTIGLEGLLNRTTENLVAYITRIIPEGVVGDGLPVAPPLGVGFALLTLVGWLRAVRREIGVAEIFLPLYLGLILLWPPVWSGDRFALPLLPLILFYSGVALLWLMGSFPTRLRRGALLVLILGLAIPAGLHWSDLARGAGVCRESTLAGRPRECLHPAQGEYLALAEWSGANLPEGVVVTTRKPRFFFLMSGVKALSIPLTSESDEFLDRIQAGGSRYVSLDLLDGVSGYYVYPVLLEHLGAFCGLVEVGSGEQVGTRLLGLKEEAEGGVLQEGVAQNLARCPEEMLRDVPREEGGVGGWGIPLLVREGGGRE